MNKLRTEETTSVLPTVGCLPLPDRMEAFPCFALDACLASRSLTA